MLILSGGIDLLKVNPGLVFWTVVTFSLVLLVLWKFAWSPIIKGIDDRNSKIEDDLAESEKLRTDAEKLLKETTEKLESSKQESLDIINEGKKDADVLKNKIIEEARAESKLVKDRATGEIEQAKKKALEELDHKMADLTVAVLAKVLKTDITKEEHKKIIAEEIQTIRKSDLKH